MEELKKLCPTCQEKKDIIKIERDQHSETIILSCGHKQIKEEITEVICVSDSIMAKHKDPLGKLLSRYKTKLSGEAKRPARDEIVIDRIMKKLFHKVWEQNNEGEWELVHDEEKPLLESKNRKRNTP